MKEYKVNDYVILNFGTKAIGRVAAIYSQAGYEIQFQNSAYYTIHPNEIERPANDNEIFAMLMET